MKENKFTKLPRKSLLARDTTILTPKEGKEIHQRTRP
jgi:hypothetical protein